MGGLFPYFLCRSGNCTVQKEWMNAIYTPHHPFIHSAPLTWHYSHYTMPTSTNREEALRQVRQSVDKIFIYHAFSAQVVCSLHLVPYVRVVESA